MIFLSKVSGESGFVPLSRRDGKRKSLSSAYGDFCRHTPSDFYDGRVQRNRLAARFGLRVPEVIPHAGAPNVDLHEFEVDVGPGERNQLRSPQAGATGKHHHRAFPNIEHCDE